jgi:riboflavin kinase / FMN adenylyltransferase
MKIIEGIENIKEPFKNAVITIGNFDGVHIGHQALFQEVIQKADAIGGTSAAMTFEPHPIRFLKQGSHPPLITLLEQKLELISKTGLDVLICVPFNKAFADIPARNFLEDILIQQIGMKAFVVGGDYAFGKNREGNLDFLRKSSGKLGFELIVADWIQAPLNGKTRISSTRIRELVMNGDIGKAEKMLGRPYQIRGIVEHGRNRGGRLLGFPTANIKLHDELAPKTGVYAVTVEHKNERYKGVANIGYSPTFDDKIYTIEVHLLDFDGDLYDRKIQVNFIAKLRDEIKFSGIDALSKQIHKDIEVAKQLLSL